MFPYFASFTSTTLAMFSFVNYLIHMLLLILSANQLNGEFTFGKVYFNEVFVTLYHESLQTCQLNCVDRPKCQAFSFNTRIPRDCLLNSATATANGLADRIGWVYQNRSYLAIESPCENCNMNQTCERGANRCVYRECEAIRNSDEFLILGNGNAVGSKAVMACPRDKFPESPERIRAWPVKGICEDTGLWTLQTLVCLDYVNICHEYIVGPETRPKTTDWSRFLLQDAMLVSGPCGVPDNKMTSSSKYFGSGYWAHWAKFDFLRDTWVSRTNDAHPYLQVEFDRVIEVRGIKFKGRWVRGYDMSPTTINITYSTDCSLSVLDAFVPNTTGGRTFAGTTDGTRTVEHIFNTPIKALCVRVNILEYFSNNHINLDHIGMKLDFIGTVKLLSF